MTLLENLAAHGFTIEVLQYLIACGVVVVVIGMFWQVILIGASFCFCAYVMAQGSFTYEEPHKLNGWAEKKLKQVETQQYKDFMADCAKHYDTVNCNTIWLKTENER